MAGKTKEFKIVHEILFAGEGERPYQIRIPMVVSRYRKAGDYQLVCTQTYRQVKGQMKLSKYGQSLLESCFKKW